MPKLFHIWYCVITVCFCYLFEKQLVAKIYFVYNNGIIFLCDMPPVNITWGMLGQPLYLKVSKFILNMSYFM